MTTGWPYPTAPRSKPANSVTANAATKVPGVIREKIAFIACPFGSWLTFARREMPSESRPDTFVRRPGWTGKFVALRLRKAYVRAQTEKER